MGSTSVITVDHSLKRAASKACKHVRIPWKCQLNPLLEETQIKTLDRLTHLKLIPSASEARRKQLSEGYGKLAAHMYPELSKEYLELGIDNLYFLFIYDDMSDNLASVNDPVYVEKLRLIDGRVRCILSGGKLKQDGEEEPLAVLLDSILRRCEAFSHPVWLDQYKKAVAKFFEGIRWERKVRGCGEKMNYLKVENMRAYTVGFEPCMIMGCMLRCKERALDVHGSCFLSELMRAGTLHVAWLNDVFSVCKDLRDGTGDNVVLVLSRENGLSWEAAVEHVMGLVDDETENILSLEENLEDLMGSLDYETKTFVEGLNYIVRGSYDWSMESTRYAGINGLEEEQPVSGRTISKKQAGERSTYMSDSGLASCEE
nr:TS-3 [Portieria hornemannii]